MFKLLSTAKAAIGFLLFSDIPARNRVAQLPLSLILKYFVKSLNINQKGML
jgi:hypothetical protein